MGNATESRRHVLVVRGSFATLGGAERELLQLIPKLENHWKVSLATLSFPEDAQQLLESTTVEVYKSKHTYNPPINAISEVRNIASKQALRLWKSVEIPWDTIDVVHLSVCRGTLEILPRIPVHIPIHYHCLEPPRWLYEDVLHRRLDGTIKRPSFITNLAFRKQKKDDQRFVKMLLARPNSTLSGNSLFTANRLTSIYKFARPCTKENGLPPERDGQRRPLQSTFLHHAIDLEKWPIESSSDEQTATANLNLPEKYVVTIGKISHVKGTMESVAMLKNTNIALVHIGGGNESDKQKLTHFAKTIGVDFICMPQLTQEQICGVFRGSIAVISHAYGEPFGLTPIEALSIGVPPVMVRDGGFVETMSLLDESFLFDRNDMESWHRGLERAQKIEHRDRCIKSGRAFVDAHFSLDHEAIQLSRLLNEQLNS
jgi:glycosyltransferase involved in cell wall biosynthesis